MKKEEKKIVSATVNEKGYWIRVGFMPLYIRPLTLAQIYDMGEYTQGLQGKGLALNEQTNTIAEMFLRSHSAYELQNIFIIAAFRNRIMRYIFGRYIKYCLTATHINSLVQCMTASLTPNFFLASIIFLSQITHLTEPSQTIAHGQSSGE